VETFQLSICPTHGHGRASGPAIHERDTVRGRARRGHPLACVLGSPGLTPGDDRMEGTDRSTFSVIFRPQIVLPTIGMRRSWAMMSQLAETATTNTHSAFSAGGRGELSRAYWVQVMKT
jgi:hypothetical protein